MSLPVLKMENQDQKDRFDRELTFAVRTNDVIRIDKYLANLNINELYSRSFIDRLLKKGFVTLDGKVVKKSEQVHKDQLIHVKIPPPTKKDILPENIELSFVYEDEHLAIIDKPAGMVVHPAPGHYHGTLVNAIMYHMKHLSSPDDPLRPGIVHRLDKDTSGLIIVAKNDFVHVKLKELFANHEIQKIYIAFTMGNLTSPEGTISTLYGRNPLNSRKMAVLEEGKLAVTHYEVIETYPGLDITKIMLETGRTHQIRVHFSHLIHPIMGDTLYSSKKQMINLVPERAKKIVRHLFTNTLRRQALHAHQLEFVHPITHKTIFVTSPLPQDMDNVLKIIRKSFYGSVI